MTIPITCGHCAATVKRDMKRVRLFQCGSMFFKEDGRLTRAEPCYVATEARLNAHIGECHNAIFNAHKVLSGGYCSINGEDLQKWVNVRMKELETYRQLTDAACLMLGIWACPHCHAIITPTEPHHQPGCIHSTGCDWVDPDPPYRIATGLNKSYNEAPPRQVRF